MLGKGKVCYPNLFRRDQSRYWKPDPLSLPSFPLGLGPFLWLADHDCISKYLNYNSLQNEPTVSSNPDFLSDLHSHLPLWTSLRGRKGICKKSPLRY